MDIRVGQYIQKKELHPRDYLDWDQNFFQIGNVSDWWDLNKSDLSWASKWWALVPRTFIFQQVVVNGSIKYKMDVKTFKQLVELKAIMEHKDELGWSPYQFRHVCEMVHITYVCEPEIEPYFDEVVELIR